MVICIQRKCYESRKWEYSLEPNMIHSVNILAKVEFVSCKKMKKLIYITFLVCVFSCKSGQNTSVKYSQKSTDSSSNTTYLMNVPSGFNLVTLVGGNRELEKQYVYSDSSKLYISDFRNSILNYDNIISLGIDLANKRFEGIELKREIAKELGKDFILDDLVLEGKASNGLYWKDIRKGYIYIGYVNVSEQRKEEFDKALESFRKR